MRMVEFSINLLILFYSFLERRASNHINDLVNVAAFTNHKKVKLFYFLQALFLIPLIFVYIALVILPVLLFWNFTNFSWYKCIFGPYLLNVMILVSAIGTIPTLIEIKSAFPYFNPMIGLKLWEFSLLKEYFSFTRSVAHDKSGRYFCFIKNSHCWIICLQ